MDRQLLTRVLDELSAGSTNDNIPFLLDTVQPSKNPFMGANTIESSLLEIQNNHIIPVFVKDNEKVISHFDFISSMMSIVKGYFHGETILSPQIRLSHPIKGRIPEARNKAARDLLEHEETLYYERMAFVIEIPSVSNFVNGNRVNLAIGGVKAYNLDNLNTKSGAEQSFKIFCGFQNQVCTNMCVASDGYVGDLKVRDIDRLETSIKFMLSNYDGLNHLEEMASFSNYFLTEQQFALLIGRCRMYKHLPESDKESIPALMFGDNQINSICKDYYKDQNFSRSFTGSINLWNLYNLFTEANKSSYIDTFLDRSLNAYQLTQELKTALKHKNDCWYLT